MSGSGYARLRNAAKAQAEFHARFRLDRPRCSMSASSARVAVQVGETRIRSLTPVNYLKQKASGAVARAGGLCVQSVS